MNENIDDDIIEVEDAVLGKVEIGCISKDVNYNYITFKLFKMPYFIKNYLEFSYKDQTLVEAIYNCFRELADKIDVDLYGDYELYDKICRDVIKINFKEILKYRPNNNSKIRVLYSINQNDCAIHFVENSLEIKGKGICFFNENNSRIFCNGKIGKSDNWWKGDISFIIGSYFENVFNKDDAETTADDYRVFFELNDYDKKNEEETFYIKNTNQDINEIPTNKNSSKGILMLRNYVPSTSVSFNEICDAKSLLNHLPTINQNGTKYCRMLFLSKNNSGKSLK